MDKDISTVNKYSYHFKLFLITIYIHFFKFNRQYFFRMLKKLFKELISLQYIRMMYHYC